MDLEETRVRTSYLDLDVASRADMCFAPQHVLSAYQRTYPLSTYSLNKVKC